MIPISKWGRMSNCLIKRLVHFIKERCSLKEKAKITCQILMGRWFMRSQVLLLEWWIFWIYSSVHLKIKNKKTQTKIFSLLKQISKNHRAEEIRKEEKKVTALIMQERMISKAPVYLSLIFHHLPQTNQPWFRSLRTPCPYTTIKTQITLIHTRWWLYNRTWQSLMRWVL